MERVNVPTPVCPRVLHKKGHHDYTRYRAVERVSQGAGRRACSGGEGGYRFEYHVNQSTAGNGNDQYDPNIWRMRSIDYDSAGLPSRTTNAKGQISDRYFDMLGRTTRTIENYVDGLPSNDDDQTVDFAYNGNGSQPTTPTKRLGLPAAPRRKPRPSMPSAR